MSNPFSRTTRSLEREGSVRGTAWIAGALVLLAGWSAWFVWGRVPVYEVTEAARLEVRSAAHPVSAPVGGRVVASYLELDRPVAEGAVLVEIDGSGARLALAEAATRVADLAAQREALELELRVEREGVTAAAGAREVAVREAQARAAEAEVRAELAEAEARRVEALGAAGGIAEMERERVQAEARARRATARALQLTAARLDRDARLGESDRRKRVAELEREVVELRGAETTERARAARLEHEAGLLRIRAPIAGRIGEAAELRVGSVVEVGEKLASVVPTGEVRAAAYFPAAALGRVRAGQPARVRLAGFPWTEYGTLPARVSYVATETREGRFRVELALSRDAASSAPVQHGLPGSVEVEVERVSPATLVMRVAGRRIAPVRAAAGRVAAR